MATIRYKGHKPKVPVTFPIGVKFHDYRTVTKFADPYLDMSDEDAAKLIMLDPHNFEIVAQRQDAEPNEPKRKGKGK